MKTEEKLITPATAEVLLKKNTMNRVLRPMKLSEYERQMKAGLWKEETGEAIKIATDGAIIDGQHRLTALIKANVSLMFLFITGLEKDVFTVIDSGAVRTSGDVFHIAGIENARNIAAGIRTYYMLNVGNKQFHFMRGLSSTEALSLYNKKPDFWQAAYTMAIGWYGKSARILSPSLFAGFYAFFYDIDNDDAFEFMSYLGDGIDLSLENPIRLLRDKLLFAKLNPKFNLIQSVKTSMIIKTWNHFRNKTTLKILKVDIGREGYPIAI